MGHRVFALALLLALATPRAAHAQDHVGLNVHVPAPDLIDLCAAAGVTWARMDGDWLSLNPARGRFEWAALDRSIDAANARGIRVFLTLGYTPVWVPRVSRARTDTAPQNDEPATSDEWRAFVTEAVRRYRARGVRHFGMWNEANLEQFWEQSAGIDAYVDKILVPGAAAVRAACGDCLVLGPDLAHLGEYDRALDRILERGRSSIDILTHHIYSGWPETGTTVFSGDSFLQALETRRFPFTRAALREVLDARGYTGDVWITETGLRANPPGDAAAEQRQATYVRRALEEQLSRRWWTHTFFYEVTDCGVDQPGCDIDGFGVTRPLRQGARTFPTDYRLKPAFNTLRDFIRAHPEVVSRSAPAQCANGLDDDRDGRADAEDRGCANGTDTNEGDDPPRTVLRAISLGSNEIRVDGDLSEWSDAGWVTLDRAQWVGTIPLLVASDVGARVAARWSAGTLYVAAEVTDDRHVNDRGDDSLWAGDSLQLAFDPGRERGLGYDANDHELTFALARNAPRAFRQQGPAGVTGTGTSVVRRDGTATRYEIALPMSTLMPTRVTAGSVVGFSFVVNDNDGQTTAEGNGREGWLEFTPGIARRKDPYHFGELHLVDAEVTDAGAAPDVVTADVPTRADVTAAQDVLRTTDTGVTVDVPAPGAGCGCATRAPSRPHALAVFVMGLLLAGRRRRRGLLAMLTALAGCADDGVREIDGSAIADGDGSALTVVPAGVFSGTLDLPTTGPATLRLRAVATTRDGRQGDVSARARWTVSGVGDLTQVLAPQGDFSAMAPGEYTVRATLGAQSASLMVRVRLVATVENEQPGNGPLPTTGFEVRPAVALAYPPDGAVFPVNLRQVEVQLRRGQGTQTRYALRLTNTLLDLTLRGPCRVLADPAGCGVMVPDRFAGALAAASEAGPLTLRAGVTAEDGSALVEAPPLRVSWANVPLQGALYYWSTRIGENTTAIQRMDLGRGLAPERWYQQGRDAPEINGERPCVGCHAISRDGRRMGISYGGSDPGSFALIDVATRRPLAQRLAPRAYGGPATFASMSALSPDAARVVTVLRGVMTLRRADASLAPLGTALFATGLTSDDRATQPQWSDDGRLLAFVGFNPALYDCNNPPCGDRARDNGDLAPYGQIYVSSFAADRFAAPTLLVPREGMTHTSHYPAFSDDARWVVFNQVRCDAPGNDQGYAVDRTGRAANCAGYDNPGTRIRIVPTAGGASIDLRALNTERTWTNSWPRFGPSHGQFRRQALYWVAFSSKRPYGLQLPGDATGRTPNVAPQLWLSAITLGQGDVPTGDPSAPAVWLSGQNLGGAASGNHVPQWVQTYVPTPE